jgi:probable phosphoglycerate mutase
MRVLIMGKMNLYIIRHGETYLNRFSKMQGWADSPLTEEGKVVAVETGVKLSHIPFDRVYTSDLGRTIETAKLIIGQNQHNKNHMFNKTKEFREFFFGSFEGDDIEITWNKLASDNGFSTGIELMDSFSVKERLDAYKNSDPLRHAEDHQTFTSRLEKGLVKIISDQQNEEENILLVTHGVVVLNLIHKFSETPIGRIKIKNASVTHVEYSNGHFKLISYNQ